MSVTMLTLNSIVMYYSLTNECCKKIEVKKAQWLLSLKSKINRQKEKKTEEILTEKTEKLLSIQVLILYSAIKDKSTSLNNTDKLPIGCSLITC